ncbi:thiopurine S-methyltransferase [Halioxenophilus aromaticivorans]|uniref:Thiopurine S-methyltransferase n=1 Tax=Halioxenophilus aromaticivorans TaxID=1306992 RepID=A0AAV3U2M0_9ALTE
MEADFWHQRWQTNEIGFHEAVPNPMLTQYLGRLPIAPGDTVLVPLCGKSHDLTWLTQQGYQVVGIELSKLAVEAYFEQINQTPAIDELDNFTRYRGEQITIYVGNFFDVTADIVGTINAIYDRAALVAMPRDMRKEYAKHLLAISAKAPKLLVTFEYDQSIMDGPPFSLSEQEVREHYDSHYDITRAFEQTVPGKLRGTEAKESVWVALPL